MKYMGSKRKMLNNGLGNLLLKEIASHSRFVDLFCGSASVASFIAEKTNRPVFAVDLQRFATVLAESVICREEPIDPNKIITTWVDKVNKKKKFYKLWKSASKLRLVNNDINFFVQENRILCETNNSLGPVWNAYGGYYFSASQAFLLDLFLHEIPHTEYKSVCLAALITSAIQCAASPGHTAQPFQPTPSAGKYSLEAWKKDPSDYITQYLREICPKHALTRGQVATCDAFSILENLEETDLVFIDPPYSNVQYSRFYQVLETIACEKREQAVFGTGRNSPLKERPQSKFSNIGEAKDALSLLLQKISQRRCTCIFTFPSGQASNGISGDYLKQIASDLFTVEDFNNIQGKFSTLGGNNNNRESRKESNELILILRPLPQV